ncbi:hypothetical protein [Gilliamella sp. Nev3-1]|uniref:hypothetical protein n=1 Tax=Gilliamella sp. Nev3-1 TaxID=3120250 RepID=UPI00080E745C|nr:hypothetical protein [Gilliamella apicola]OCG61011.1 hypothetical protein A9G40_02790 [Gilliamella apicola]
MNSQFKHKKSNCNKLSNHLSDLFNKLINNNPQACETNEIAQGFGEFGLSITNPIPVNSIQGIEDYLSHLRLDNGTKISWKRIGSTGADNISNIIDIYEIMTYKGETITDLYISPYHLKTSNKAPKGFKILK